MATTTGINAGNHVVAAVVAVEEMGAVVVVRMDNIITDTAEGGAIAGVVVDVAMIIGTISVKMNFQRRALVRSARMPVPRVLQ